MLRDPARLAALAQSGLEPDRPVQGVDALDRLAALVAKLFNVPFATVTLVDDERQAFPGLYCTLPVSLELRETPISHSICEHVVTTGAPLIIHDASRDERVSNHPAVREVGVAAYVGVPLITVEGHVLGSLCAVDIVPRSWTEADMDTLHTLANFALTELEVRRTENRAQAAEHLRAVKAQSDRDRLVEVFRRSPSFIAILRGPEHVYEFVNDAYCRLAGRQASDILLRPIREVLHEVAGQGFFEMFDRVYATGEPCAGSDVPVLLLSEPGQTLTEHFVDFVFQATRGPDGTIDGLFVHGVDWTERKLAQKGLADVAEQRRMALDSAQMGWWHLDLVNSRVQMDERFRAIFGLGKEWLDQEQVNARIHPEDLPLVVTAAGAATRVQEPEPFSIEYRVRHEDGSIHWVAAKGQAAFEGQGPLRRATTLVGTVVDITEARAIQEALRESEGRFREVANAMPQIVWTARADGHVDYYNQRWYEFTGVPQNKFGNESWAHILHPDDLGPVTQIWTASLASGQAYEAEFRLRRAADGAYRWMLGRGVPVTAPGSEVVRWIGTLTDIHERKELQRQNMLLLDSERTARSDAERTSQMKDEFLATLSHELRTPLNAILGWTQVLRGDPSNVEDVQQGLATIERNARAQTQIIEDLLDMSRIISGKVRLDVQRLDLAPALEAAIDTMRPAADAKGIRLQAVLDPVARPVSGDPSRLQQVFWNLLSNAIKFTPRGGRVQVLLERVNSHLEVSVIDSGEGIAADFLPHVFDRFRQADASTTRQHGGLGLGLAIVKQLVELHGGSVRAKSGGPGTGTTFVVALPLTVLHPEAEGRGGERRHPRAQDEASRGALSSEGLDLGGVKVLVLDDEADARALVKRLLEDRGARVRVAGTVEDTLRLLAEEKPDVLVSDIGMPGQDGYALMRRVRALGAEQGGDVPAVALTAYARAEDRMKAILAGFQMHVSKPVEPAELLTMVASLAGRTGTGGGGGGGG